MSYSVPVAYDLDAFVSQIKNLTGLDFDTYYELSNENIDGQFIIELILADFIEYTNLHGLAIKEMLEDAIDSVQEEFVILDEPSIYEKHMINGQNSL